MHSQEKAQLAKGFNTTWKELEDINYLYQYDFEDKSNKSLH